MASPSSVAKVRLIRGARFRISKVVLSLQFFRWAAHHLPHFDGHVPRSPSWPGRRRSPRCDSVRLLRALHINNPVSGEKFFGLWENSISNNRRPIRRPTNRDSFSNNRLSVASSANDPGLVWERQAFGCDVHARVFEFLAEIAHENKLLLEVLFRPLGVPVKIGLRTRHHQNVFHVFFAPR